MKIFLRLVKAALFVVMLISAHELNAQNQQNANKQLKKTKTVTTKYGLYPVKTDADSRLVASNNTGVDYIRTSVTLDTWDGGNNSTVDYWLLHKKKIVLNINYDNTYFPTNLTDYKSMLQSFLNIYADSIELAVIENEELNYDTTHNIYHIGSMQDYINELTTAVSVCSQKKVLVTNGGLATQVVASLKHYYDINGKTDSSQWLLTQMGGIPADSMVWKRCDSLLDAYKTLALSYVNLHWYEPKKGMTRITGVLQTVCNYITTRTGKKVITNESGTRSDSSFITLLMQQWSLIKPDYCILYDGNAEHNNGAMGLTSLSGALLPTGMAYRDYLGGGKACTQAITVSPSGFINLCSSDSLKLTASNGFGNYLWSTGQTTQSITVKNAGNYSVKSNQNSCMAYTNTAAAVSGYTQPSNPVVTTNPSPLVNICPGRNVQLLSSLSRSYLWNTGDTTKNISVKSAGNYIVTIVDNNGCKATSNVTAVAYQACAAPEKLKVKDIGTNNATLNWNSVSCAVGYQLQYRITGVLPWTTQQILSGATTSKTVYGLTAAVYQWRMFTYCSYAPDTVESAYINGPEFTVKAKNSSNAIAVTLNDLTVKIFPVPATNIASVSVTPVRSNLQIKLMDIYGKILWQKEKITDAVTNLPVANLAAGMYIVVVKDDEQSKTLNIIKQ